MSEQQIGMWGHAKGLLKDVFTSKKFMAMISGLIANLAVLGAAKVGVSEEQAAAAATKITGLVAAYLVGQGVADAGKEGKKLEIKEKAAAAEKAAKKE